MFLLNLVKLFCLFCVITPVVNCLRADRVDFSNLYDAIEHLRDEFETKPSNVTLSEEEEFMKKVIQELPSGMSREEGLEGNPYMCDLCIVLGTQAIFLRRYGLLSDNVIERIAIGICNLLRIQTNEVCTGLIKFNLPTIIYIADNRRDLTASTVCRIVFETGRCTQPIDDKELDFKIDVDRKKLFIKKPTVNSEKKQKKDEDNIADVIRRDSSTEKLNIVQITDIHYDAEYLQNSPADCGIYACCRNSTKKTKQSAGYWGDYNHCDTPWRAIVDTFTQIKNNHQKIDAIYFTGDIVNHFMWVENSEEAMKPPITKVMNYMYEVFDGIPIFPILGNHEAQNVFAPPVTNIPSKLSTKWLYQHVSTVWNKTLPVDTMDTIKYGGFYTTIVKDKLRVIALNTNVCYIFNWWTFYDSSIMKTQLQWLHDTLQEAEKNDEKVHILSHMYNGHEDNHKPCSREYRRIIDRFSDIVVSEFHGHTEYFDVNVVYRENNPSDPVSIAFSGGSVASFIEVNRNYIVYSIDPVTYEVDDLDLWTYNLTLANQNQDQSNPLWFKQFSFKSLFNLDDMSPKSIHNLLTEAMTNSTLAQQLRKLAVRDSDYPGRRNCDKTCQKRIICGMVTSDNNDDKICERMQYI